jgi:hypothetical protein
MTVKQKQYSFRGDNFHNTSCWAYDVLMLCRLNNKRYRYMYVSSRNYWSNHKWARYCFDLQFAKIHLTLAYLCITFISCNDYYIYKKKHFSCWFSFSYRYIIYIENLLQKKKMTCPLMITPIISWSWLTHGKCIIAYIFCLGAFVLFPNRTSHLLILAMIYLKNCPLGIKQQSLTQNYLKRKTIYKNIFLFSSW